MNTLVVLMGIAFGIGETAYFGWNFLPGSEAELICDGIALLIVAIGMTGRSSVSANEGAP
jgi:hypothetical protein